MSEAVPLYHYKGNEVMPIVAAVLFGITMVISIYRTHVSKSWKYMWPWILGLCFEVSGYAIRLPSVKNPTTDGGIGLFAVSATLIIIAPALLAATMYMSFGRLVRYIDGGGASMIAADKVTKVFVLLDILSFIVQSGGGSMTSAEDSTVSKYAKYVIIGGLVIQLVAFSVFLIFSVVYKSRVQKKEIPTGNCHKLLYMLWIVGILILIRSVFRLVEFAGGEQNGDEETSYLLTHEVFFYVLEALPIFIAACIFAIFPPSTWLPSDKNASLNGLPFVQSASAEKASARKAAKREERAQKKAMKKARKAGLNTDESYQTNNPV